MHPRLRLRARDQVSTARRGDRGTKLPFDLGFIAPGSLGNVLRLFLIGDAEGVLAFRQSPGLLLPFPHLLEEPATDDQLAPALGL